MAGRATLRIFGLLFVVLLALPLRAQDRKSILIVFDEDRDLPGLAMINQSLRDTLKGELRDDVEFWSESLNLSQFKNPGYDAALRDHFRRKYAGKRPDLIFAVMQPSLDFLLRDERVLFPGVPIVFCGVDSSYLETNRLPQDVVGVAVERNYAPTAEIALRLQPRTRNVYVIGGTSAFDRQLQAIARGDLAPLESRVRVHYLTSLPMRELLSTVSKLPPDSVVMYLSLFADGSGQAFVPHDALAQITAEANAPVFVAVDQYLDRGAVGGHVYSISSHGRQSAEIGLQILRGQTPRVVDHAVYRDVFDWRQLKRWGFDERRLPPGSEIRNRTRSVWEQYKWYFLGFAAVCLLQSALIIALLVSRAQRERAFAATRQAETRTRQAEEEVHRKREELAHALRLTTLGELAASFAHEMGQPLSAILINAQSVHRLVASRMMTAEELDEALADIEEDATRAAETIQRLRGLFRKEKAQRTSVDMNEIIEDVVHLLRADLKRKGIHVEFHRAETLPSVVGDPVQLRQVILNLLINAEDAVTREPDGERKIDIETNAIDGATVAVTVRDTGSGVEGVDVDRMFERFVSTKPSGLGMGLAISRSIVEAHSGKVWATSNHDRGLSLHLEFPSR